MDEIKNRVKNLIEYLSKNSLVIVVENSKLWRYMLPKPIETGDTGKIFTSNKEYNFKVVRKYHIEEDNKINVFLVKITLDK